MSQASSENRDWNSVRQEWELRPGVTYLNHGSFGPSPRSVISARERWSRRLESEPMDFLVREMEPALDAAADTLGRFLGTRGESLLFVPNATVAMNIVAASVRLRPGDEVLASNHEYGAVLRIWREACRAANAELVVRRLPDYLESDEAIANELLAGVTPKTRLIVVSHVTSPTAVILPVAAICRGARSKGVPVCIDGPHAPAMIPVEIDALGCDYYCASLHKWLSAPFGSGCLYVAPKHQQALRPIITSWGGSISGRAKSWKDEFNWFGTYDPAPVLAVTEAIGFLDGIGLDLFRSRTRELARLARKEVTAISKLEPRVADSPERYGSMIALPLPPLHGFEGGHGRPDPLQVQLWREHQIEVPIMHWGGQRLLRVSCHLYNNEADLERLCSALRAAL